MANSQATYTVFESDCPMLSDLELSESSLLRLDEEDDDDDRTAIFGWILNENGKMCFLCFYGFLVFLYFICFCIFVFLCIFVFSCVFMYFCVFVFLCFCIFVFYDETHNVFFSFVQAILEPSVQTNL